MRPLPHYYLRGEKSGGGWEKGGDRTDMTDRVKHTKYLVKNWGSFRLRKLFIVKRLKFEKFLKFSQIR